MRIRRVLLAAVVATVVTATAPSAAGAQDPLPEASYCSSSGDYCQTVRKKRGVRYIEFVTFSLRGRVKLCVTPPRGGRTCRRFRMRQNKEGVFSVRVRWAKHFPRRGKGTYRARFSQGSFRAPVMRFRVG